MDHLLELKGIDVARSVTIEVLEPGICVLSFVTQGYFNIKLTFADEDTPI